MIFIIYYLFFILYYFRQLNNSLAVAFGGRGWIRTTEAISSRFTVCPLWPLGNSPILSGQATLVPLLELVMGLEPATC